MSYPLISGVIMSRIHWPDLKLPPINLYNMPWWVDTYVSSVPNRVKPKRPIPNINAVLQQRVRG